MLERYKNVHTPIDNSASLVVTNQLRGIVKHDISLLGAHSPIMTCPHLCLFLSAGCSCGWTSSSPSPLTVLWLRGWVSEDRTPRWHGGSSIQQQYSYCSLEIPRKASMMVSFLHVPMLLQMTVSFLHVQMLLQMTGWVFNKSARLF